MSLPVEAITIVVRRDVLDTRYIGRTPGYLADIADPAFEARWVCADAHLTAASFAGDDVLRVLARLDEQGLTGLEADRWIDMAVVDQVTGPTSPCDWLAWKPVPEGFSMCWLQGTDPESLCTPAGWTPDPHIRANRRDARDAAAMVLLAKEDGSDTWLNTETGALEVYRADPSRDVVGPLMRLLHLALEAREWSYVASSHRTVHASFPCGLLQCELVAEVREETEFVEARAYLPLYVPRSRRVACRALLDRVNREHYMPYTVDEDSGRVSAYFNADLSGGKPSRQLMLEFLAVVERLCQQHQSVLIRELAAPRPERSRMVDC